METDENLNLIFYLTFGQKLPKVFYDLAVTFKNKGLTLVPVELDQLLDFYQGKKNVHVVVVTKNQFEKKAYQKSLKIINHALRSGKMFFYHLSSFSDIDLRKEKGRINNYSFISLPISIEVLAQAVKNSFLIKQNSIQKWPGGRRGRLPFEELV